MADTNLPAEGAMAAPPPGAPYEIAQPLSPELIAEQAAKAAAHEKTLAPLTYGQTESGGVVRPRLESAVAGKQIDGLDPFYQQEVARRTAEDAEISAHAPAGSDTDSPVRGLPGTAPIPAVRSRAQLLPSGGFGDTGAAQYYPLDGSELRALVETLMDELHAHIQADLRFSIAACYPRVAVKVQLVVEGEVQDQGFTIQKVGAHDKTPLEVAQACGDSVVFVVVKQRREFDEAGNVEAPPDALRDELGLPKPHKHVVKNGLTSSFADLPMGF
jgi:hypothetical protein